MLKLPFGGVLDSAQSST